MKKEQKTMSTSKDSKRIDTITVKRQWDDDGETDWMGTFSDEPKDYAIVHTGRNSGQFVDEIDCTCGHAKFRHVETEDNYAPCDRECSCDDYDADWPERGREYRFFNPNAENYADEPEADIRKYCLQDYERMKALSNNQWGFIGISAEAQLRINGVLQTIASGGLWGVESDSDQSYLMDVEQEELNQLKSQLHTLGFSKRAINAAFREVEQVEA